MKLEEGMYVRTKSFKGFPSKIGKITKIEYNAGIDNETYIALDNDEEKCRRWTEDWLIGKPSFNPVDLIEVGDYVNGLKITLINEPSMANCYKRIVYAEDEKGYLIKSFVEEDIKSIVTKEMFSSVEYRMETD